jgi:hypothetical protein
MHNLSRVSQETHRQKKKRHTVTGNHEGWYGMDLYRGSRLPA